MGAIGVTFFFISKIMDWAKARVEVFCGLTDLKVTTVLDGSIVTGATPGPMCYP